MVKGADKVSYNPVAGLSTPRRRDLRILHLQHFNTYRLITDSEEKRNGRFDPGKVKSQSGLL